MPPKAKRKKVIWNNNDCKADVCKRPELTSTWVKCDECKKWYHMVCVEVTEDQLPDKKDWYCPNCHIVKSQEYDTVKEMLFSKVSDLASSQQDFNSITISRDMFKFKKNAGTFNFATEFPPTLQELNKRIQSKFATMADFRFEYKLMCKKLIEELMSNYASQVQFIEFELDDIFEEITKPVEPEPEPEPEMEPEFNPEPEMEAGMLAPGLMSNNNPEPLAFGIAGGGLIKIKQERGNVIDLGVSALNSSMDYSGDEDDHTVEFSSQDEDLNEENDVHESPEKLSCTHCSKGFTDAGIYSCKRDHNVCANCRMMIPGCVCPVCHQEFGDRKRLALDHHANAIVRLGGAGGKSSSERIKTSMAKAIRGKGGRTRTPKFADSGFSSEDGSQASLPTLGRPPKRKSSNQDQDEEEGTDVDSGFGIGMVWSCQDQSEDSKAGILTSAQIKKEKFAEHSQYSSEQETPSIDMTSMISDTQATTMLTMIHADVVQAETSSAEEMSSLNSPADNMSSLLLAAEQMLSSASSDLVATVGAGAVKGKPKQAPKRGRVSDKIVKMNISEMNELDSENRTSDDKIEFINGQIHLRVREMSKTQKYIAKLKDPKYKEFYTDKVKEMRIEIKHLSQLLTEHIKDGDVESPVKKVNTTLHPNIVAKNKSVITKSDMSPSQSIPSRSGAAAAALQSSSFYTDKLAATSSTFSAAKPPTTFVKPLIIRPRQASASPRASSDSFLPPVNRPRHPSAESILPDHHQAYLPMSLESSSISADSPIKPLLPSTSSNPVRVKQERFADENSMGQPSFQILQVESMADQPDDDHILPDNTNQMGQFICQSSFIPDENSLPSGNMPLNPVPVDDLAHHKTEANQDPYGQIDQSNVDNQAHYVDMSTAEDGGQMSMVSMDNNFVDMSCINIGDLVCSDSVVVDQEALLQDVHGSDYVPEEGVEGEQEGVGGEQEGVEGEQDDGEGDGGCYDIVDWQNNKHTSEGDFSMSNLAHLTGAAPHWVSLITVCSQTAQGLYFFEICRIDGVYQIRAYAQHPNPKDRWTMHLNGNIVLVLGGKFTSKSDCQTKELVQPFTAEDTLHFQVTITR